MVAIDVSDRSRCTTRLPGVRVLVVDDEPDALEIVTLVLIQAGAEVLGAANIDDAIELLRQRPDVIVSDLEMPGGNGLDFIRRVRWRSRDEGGTTPAIALTAHTAAVDQTRALLAGFQVHLAKPLPPDALVATIERVLRLS